MKRLALALFLVAVCVPGGTARADSSLPSAAFPNPPGSIGLADTWQNPPAQPEQLEYANLEALWQQAGAAYGVPWQVLAAINKIESNFGRNMGPSEAGAIGWMQFMPDTWLRWGMDASGDGIADPWGAADAIYSAARYLAASGAATDLRSAIFAYNHADWYVNDVLQLAALYGYTGATVPSTAQPPVQLQVTPTPPTLQVTQAQQPQPPADDGVVIFTLDRPQKGLAEAQAEVAAANEAYMAASKRAAQLLEAESKLVDQIGEADLLSDQLDLQSQLSQAAADAQQAQAEVEEARVKLEQAQKKLADLQQQQQAASYKSTAGVVLTAPVTAPVTQPAAVTLDNTTVAPGAAANWVFPVGGGPDQVSVGHTHHDYPAADIAAPEGAPLYALSDGVVLRSWSFPDERCGIGFTIQTVDGQVWTYCHMSVLDPSVQPGVQLQAGASVGLVGHTGHASGPHLHLQLQPATSYPQVQAWFRSFAGTAFRWQDAVTPSPSTDTRAPQGLVFTISQG